MVLSNSAAVVYRLNSDFIHTRQYVMLRHPLIDVSIPVSRKVMPQMLLDAGHQAMLMFHPAGFI
jgi:hypothetical protein